MADVEPFVREGDAAREEGFDFALEGEFECVESSVVFEVSAVGFAQGFKFASELVGVEIAGSIAAFVLDEVDGAGFAEELDALEPVVVVGVFFAIVCHEKVAGAIGEEELVGLVVDFLSAEVPNVDFVVFAVGACEFPVEDVDAFGGDIFGFGFEIVVGVNKFVGKTGFPATAFADDQEFGFVDVLGSIGVAGGEVVVEDGFRISGIRSIHSPTLAKSLSGNGKRISAQKQSLKF